MTKCLNQLSYPSTSIEMLWGLLENISVFGTPTRVPMRIVSPEFVEKTGLHWDAIRNWYPDVYYDALEPLKPFGTYEFVDSHRVCNCYKPRW
ncbi:unnamed protein product [Caenorhabditis nigoni]